MELTKVDLFTDGACPVNPGAGVQGALLRCKGRAKELSGGRDLTTHTKLQQTELPDR